MDEEEMRQDNSRVYVEPHHQSWGEFSAVKYNKELKVEIINGRVCAESIEFLSMMGNKYIGDDDDDNGKG